MPLKLDDIPKHLLEAYASEKCGLFIGAGLSLGAGLPSWFDLLKRMIERSVEAGIMTGKKAADCTQLADDPSKYLMLAEELREILGTDFKSAIEEIFGNDHLVPTATHSRLPRLQKNRFIITTNYDMLIEKAFAATGKFRQGYKYYEAHALLRDLYERRFFLLKAHGDAQTAADQIVLTDKDYRRILYREPGYQSALQSIFTMYSVIFVGSSLQDPELKLLLNYANAAFPEGGIAHYALMTDDEVGETERRRWGRDYNMNIIPISRDDDFADINVFLDILYDIDAK